MLLGRILFDARLADAENYLSKLLKKVSVYAFIILSSMLSTIVIIFLTRLDTYKESFMSM